jgi:valyl-tRNA synthetase
MLATGVSINLDLKRVVANRKFGNKLWQAGLFVRTRLTDHPDGMAVYTLLQHGCREQSQADGILIGSSMDLSLIWLCLAVPQLPLLPTDHDLHPLMTQPMEQWLLQSTINTAIIIRQSLDAYRFAPAIDAAHQQLVGRLCDVYLEYFKSLSPSETALALPTLVLVLKHSLVQYYPSMPFVTEELYSWLPRYVLRNIWLTCTIFGLLAQCLACLPYLTLGICQSTDVTVIRTFLPMWREYKPSKSVLWHSRYAMLLAPLTHTHTHTHTHTSWK